MTTHLHFDHDLCVPEGTKPYLVVFMFQNSNFWIPELSSLCEMEGFTCQWDEKTFDPSDHPYAVFFFPSDDAVRRVCQRSVSIRSGTLLIVF